MSNETVLTTNSTKFVSAVSRQFAAEMGGALNFTDYERTLAQHLYLKTDSQLKDLEVKRQKSGNSNKPAIIWNNVNMQKLALDAVHRVSLGLDALIPNHIHPIPYLNGRTGRYDLDLRIGYVGKIFCRMNLAIEKPTDVILNLVHKNDVFKPLMKSHSRDVESYEFEVPNPFDRGDVVGGFGYIMYDNPKRNKLVIITDKDFKKAKSASKTADFWGKDKSETEMQYKTLVHRVADKLQLDPRKVNAKSYAYVEAQEAEESSKREIEANANGDYIDVEGNADYSEGEAAEGVQDEEETEAPEPEDAEEQTVVDSEEITISVDDVPY